MKLFGKYLALGLLLALSACSPNKMEGVEGVEGFGDSGDGDVDAADGDAQDDDGANDDRAGDADADGADRLIAFGVVSSDRTAASISLLKPDGSMLAQDFIHSDSAPTGLVTALSGDVVLPTRSGTPAILTLIDRFRTDVITRVDPATGEVLGQVKTQEPNDESDDAAFSSNPQDFVQIDAETAWVSRFEPNENVDVDDPQRGNDLLRLDPTAFERTGRISLDALAGEAERTNPDTGETELVTVHARPSTMVRVGDTLIVGLARLSVTFDAIGDGMVALVDTLDETVEGFELPGLQNCGNVAPVDGDGTLVVVSCAGFFRDDPRDAAGLALLRFEDGELAIEALWRGTDDADAALAVNSVISVGGTTVIAVANGQGAPMDEDGNLVGEATNDIAYLVDVESGEQSLLFEASGRYVIGSGAFGGEQGILMMPDASTDDDGQLIGGVRRFERLEDGSFEELELIEVHEILPPLQVRAL